MAVFILEDVNYVEHYGLTRARAPSGMCARTHLFWSGGKSAHPRRVCDLQHLAQGAAAHLCAALLRGSDRARS